MALDPSGAAPAPGMPDASARPVGGGTDVGPTLGRFDRRPSLLASSRRDFPPSYGRPATPPVAALEQTGIRHLAKLRLNGTDHHIHAWQGEMIATYMRWRNARAQPKINFGPDSVIRTSTDYQTKLLAEAPEPWATALLALLTESQVKGRRSLDVVNRSGTATGTCPGYSSVIAASSCGWSVT